MIADHSSAWMDGWLDKWDRLLSSLRLWKRYANVKIRLYANALALFRNLSSTFFTYPQLQKDRRTDGQTSFKTKEHCFKYLVPIVKILRIQCRTTLSSLNVLHIVLIDYFILVCVPCRKILFNCLNTNLICLHIFRALFSWVDFICLEAFLWPLSAWIHAHTGLFTDAAALDVCI